MAAAALQKECEQLGLGLQVPAQLALLLDCSEHRAHDLLAQAGVWLALSDGLACLESGEYTEEQARTVTRKLEDLAPADAERVWEVVRERVRSRRARGVALPPQRLAELIDTVVAELLPSELAAKRAASEPDARADGPHYERFDDGSMNLYAYGLTGPNGQAALANIARRSQPQGPWDDRTDEQRRRDAITDLLTGRDPLPAPTGDLGPAGGSSSPGGGSTAGGSGCDGGSACGCTCRTGAVVTAGGAVRPDPHPERLTRCGCPPGTAVPCGVEVAALVPLATLLGLSTVPGILTGPAGPSCCPTTCCGSC